MQRRDQDSDVQKQEWPSGNRAGRVREGTLEEMAFEQLLSLVFDFAVGGGWKSMPGRGAA